MPEPKYSYVIFMLDMHVILCPAQHQVDNVHARRAPQRASNALTAAKQKSTSLPSESRSASTASERPTTRDAHQISATRNPDPTVSPTKPVIPVLAGIPKQPRIVAVAPPVRQMRASLAESGHLAVQTMQLSGLN